MKQPSASHLRCGMWSANTLRKAAAAATHNTCSIEVAVLLAVTHSSHNLAEHAVFWRSVVAG